MKPSRLILWLLSATLFVAPASDAFAQRGGSGGGGKAASPARAGPSARPAAKSAFDRTSPRTSQRVRPTRLPYRANPIPAQRSASRPGIMAEQIRAKAGRNQIRIRGVQGREMVMDVDARRPNGQRHYDKATGRSARLPHVRNDRIVTDRAPNGRTFDRRVRGSTREATIPELRTTRRFVERQARSRGAPRRAPRAQR